MYTGVGELIQYFMKWKDRPLFHDERRIGEHPG